MVVGLCGLVADLSRNFPCTQCTKHTYQHWHGGNRDNLSMTKARLEEFNVSLEWGMMGRCGACRCACACSCPDRIGIRRLCGGKELSVSAVTGCA